LEAGRFVYTVFKKPSFYAGGKTVSLLQRLAYNVLEVVYSSPLFCEKEAAARK
jgi:hypothetical protein